MTHLAENLRAKSEVELRVEDLIKPGSIVFDEEAEMVLDFISRQLRYGLMVSL